jgi:hypothetical protein
MLVYVHTDNLTAYTCLGALVPQPRFGLQQRVTSWGDYNLSFTPCGRPPALKVAWIAPASPLACCSVWCDLCAVGCACACVCACSCSLLQHWLKTPLHNSDNTSSHSQVILEGRYTHTHTHTYTHAHIYKQLPFFLQVILEGRYIPSLSNYVGEEPLTLRSTRIKPYKTISALRLHCRNTLLALSLQYLVTPRRWY